MINLFEVLQRNWTNCDSKKTTGIDTKSGAGMKTQHFRLFRRPDLVSTSCFMAAAVNYMSCYAAQLPYNHACF